MLNNFKFNNFPTYIFFFHFEKMLNRLKSLEESWKGKIEGWEEGCNGKVGRREEEKVDLEAKAKIKRCKGKEN